MSTPTIEARCAKIQEIVNRAYRYWVERQKNCIPGSDIGDWLRAEAEILRNREAGALSGESFPANESFRTNEFPANDAAASERC